MDVGILTAIITSGVSLLLGIGNLIYIIKKYNSEQKENKYKKEHDIKIMQIKNQLNNNMYFTRENYNLTKDLLEKLVLYSYLFENEINHFSFMYTTKNKIMEVIKEQFEKMGYYYMEFEKSARSC